MIDLIVFIATIACYVLLLSKKFNSQQEIVENKEETPIKSENIIDITIEYADNYIFVYRKNTWEYMAHANNREDLEKLLMLKYPDMKFNCSPEEMRLLRKI